MKKIAVLAALLITLPAFAAAAEDPPRNRSSIVGPVSLDDLVKPDQTLMQTTSRGLPGLSLVSSQYGDQADCVVNCSTAWDMCAYNCDQDDDDCDNNCREEFQACKRGCANFSPPRDGPHPPCIRFQLGNTVYFVCP